VKIALVVPGGVDRSGTHKVIPCLLWLIERLAATDEVHVFALRQEDKPASWSLLGAHVHNAGSRPRRLRALAALVAEHRRAPFDVVHAWWAGGPGAVAALFKSITRVPMVLTLPGGDVVGHRDIGYGGQLSWRSRAWIRLALRASDRIVVPSRSTQEQTRGFGVQSTRIPLGVALDRWALAAPRRRGPGDTLRLIHVANLNRVKDQPTLLAAMRVLKDRGLNFRLDIIGLDTLNGAIQRHAAELDLDSHVQFRGFMTHAETRRWVEAADIMVVSSRHETVPLVAVEAAIAGVPTVGTAVGIIADWSPGATRAVPVGNAEELANAIAELAADEQHRLSLAMAAQALAAAEDADATAEQTRALYATLSASGQEHVR